MESEIEQRESQIEEMEKLVTGSQDDVVQKLSLLNKREVEVVELGREVEELGREVEEEKMRREQLEKDLAAASGNKEEVERILSDEVCIAYF